MTNMVSGMSARFNAPVESITRSLPMLKAPGIAGTLPVAMIAFSKVTCLPAGIDSSSPSSEIVFASTNFAKPLMTLIFRFLAKPPKPPVRLLMTLFLRSRSLSSSILGSPKLTPQSACISSASETTRATCSSAFEGMQPRSKQVPPSFPSASTKTTSMPSSAAKKAAAYPPGPPPMTTS